MQPTRLTALKKVNAPRTMLRGAGKERRRCDRRGKAAAQALAAHRARCLGLVPHPPQRHQAQQRALEQRGRDRVRRGANAAASGRDGVSAGAPTGGWTCAPTQCALTSRV